MRTKKYIDKELLINEASALFYDAEIELPSPYDVLQSIKNAPLIDIDSGRIFEKLICENHNGKPYYSIQYIENGERHIGYSSYKLDCVSEWLREYFIPIINTNSLVMCKDCKYAKFVDDYEINGIDMPISCQYWNTHRTAESGFCWVGEKKSEIIAND